MARTTHRLPLAGPGEGFGAPREGRKWARGDFRSIRLSNGTHRSSTDPEALLARTSNAHPAQLSYEGDVLMDNRHALIVDCQVTQAVGSGERNAAKAMAADRPGAHQNTIGADKNDDTRGFVAEMRHIVVTPHGAQYKARNGGSATDGRTTRHADYAKSVNARRGTEKVDAVFGLHVIANNLIRLGNLLKPALEAA